MNKQCMVYAWNVTNPKSPIINLLSAEFLGLAFLVILLYKVTRCIK